MKNLLKIISVVFLVITFLSCNKDEVNRAPEVFDDASEPFFEYNINDDSYCLNPWNYEADANYKRVYPLVVYLHGKGYNGTPPSFVGYKNKEFKKAHPSFVYMPHTAGQYNVDDLIGKIKNLMEQYRIDKTRMYVIGYSMGAYWSAPLANKLEDEGIFFAAIVSMAGLSNNSNYKNEVLDKTSIWIHVGDQDGNYNKSQERFSLIKDHFLEKGASVEVSEFNISETSKYPGTTETFKLNNIEIIKNTVYEGVGHGVSHFPFQNPAVINWLFAQNINKRY